MVYRFQLRRNPRSLLVPAIAVLLPAASVAIIVLYHPLLGVLALLVSAYIGYFLVKYFLNTIRSQIRTTGEGLHCTTAMGSDSEMSWEDLSHAGWYAADSGYREFFVYAEAGDKLLSIPPHYENMDALCEEIQAHGLTLLSLSGEETDGLADALRELLVPEGEIIDDEEEAVPD